jgi:hypothetical protein
VEGLLQHMLDKGNVWIASMEEIAAHVRSVTESGEYTPRVETLPYYPEPVQVPLYQGDK